MRCWAGRGIIPIVDFDVQANRRNSFYYSMPSTTKPFLCLAVQIIQVHKLLSCASYLCLRRDGFAGAKLGGSTREDFQQVVSTCAIPQLLGRLTAYSLPRLNSKVKPRDVAVKDLVTDLSDGVRSRPPDLRNRWLNSLSR